MNNNQEKTLDFTTFHYQENRFKNPEEDLNYWKTEIKIAKLKKDLSLPTAWGMIEILENLNKIKKSLEKEEQRLAEKYDSVKEIESAITRKTEYLKKLQQEAETPENKKIALNNLLYEKDKKIIEYKEKLKGIESICKIYAHHKSTCNIVESLENGRLLNKKHCNCGLQTLINKVTK